MIKFENIAKKKEGVTLEKIYYQLIKTDAIDTTEANMRDVYSILALSVEREATESDFVYDVSRNKKDAEEILRLIEEAMPKTGELADLISELI